MNLVRGEMKEKKNTDGKTAGSNKTGPTGSRRTWRSRRRKETRRRVRRIHMNAQTKIQKTGVRSRARTRITGRHAARTTKGNRNPERRTCLQQGPVTDTHNQLKHGQVEPSAEERNRFVENRTYTVYITTRGIKRTEEQDKAPLKQNQKLKGTSRMLAQGEADSAHQHREHRATAECIKDPFEITKTMH
jgi:hypothetical protein